jgi:hypothetical protein
MGVGGAGDAQRRRVSLGFARPKTFIDNTVYLYTEKSWIAESQTEFGYIKDYMGHPIYTMGKKAEGPSGTFPKKEVTDFIKMIVEQNDGFLQLRFHEDAGAATNDCNLDGILYKLQHP